MAVIEISKIQVRRGQEQQTGIPQLDAGEFGWAQDTEQLYIGKRIEEGAVDDENTRILTENDLNYFKLLALNNTSTAASIYRYRETVLLNTTSTSIQTKLDSLDPSLVDFGVAANTGTYVQIDSVLQNAINDLFVNIDPNKRVDYRRQLQIPAGLFYLSNTVDLPPYTRLSGAGAGLTRIKYTNTASNMFRTVDIAGDTFENGNMDLTTGSSRDIVIQGITFEFDNTLGAAKSLISLDNVNKALIQDCTFQTAFNSESTTTYGIVNHGVGVQIRGQGLNGTEKCKNVSIERCEFNGLLIGVWATGTVITPSIRNSVFQNLQQGVVFETHDTSPGPSNGYIAYNRFQDILKEAIYVGSNSNNRPSSTLSTQNHFSRVGGNNFNEFTTASTITAPIKFDSPGNKTVDDFFARKFYVENDLTSLTGFYYNPYVRGNATIADSAVYTKNIAAATDVGAQSSATYLAKVPLNGGNQFVSINYQLYSSNQSRSGKILANVDSAGNVGLNDTYNYVETLKQDTLNITTASGSTVNLLVINTATNPRFATVQTSIGNWFLTGESYPGKSAFITNVVTSGTFYYVYTDSNSPTFNFSSAGTYTLLTSFSVDISSTYDKSTALTNNFVSFIMQNPNTTTNFTMDYQIDIQT
jgi:hypothetical protein